MRAVTVPVSTTSGVAGFVFPGDRVDMVLTQDGRRRRRRPAAQGFRDDRPQRARARHRPAHRQQGRGRQDRGPDLRQRDPRGHPEHRREDRRRAVLGSCRLSLRSIADNTAELERAVAAGEIKVPAGANPAEERHMLLAIATRPIDSNTTFTTGGDVSRFQRRTRPGPPPRATAGSRSALSASAPRVPAAPARRRPSGPIGPRRSRQQCHRRSGGSTLR